MIWLTSDLHFCHNREFLYKPRGFNSIEAHDEALVQNWNNVVNSEDLVYILGDLFLNNNEKGIEYLKRLNGNICIILGNHDTPNRQNLIWQNVKSVMDITYADMMKYKSSNGRMYNFYLTHYPSITSNLDNEAPLSQHIINLYGHTHQKTNFYNDIPWIYHVGVDSHNCTPVSIEQIIKDCKNKYKEWKDMF